MKCPVPLQGISAPERLKIDPSARYQQVRGAKKEHAVSYRIS